MNFWNFAQIVLVGLVISGCKCSGTSKLKTAADEKSSQGNMTDHKLHTQNESGVKKGEETAPVDESVDDGDKPALPLDRDGGKKKKVVKVAKKPDLPEYCKIVVQSDDSSKYSISKLKIVRSCPKIRLTLFHKGSKPREVGGHNLVIVENRRIEDLLERALVAGSINHYIPRNDGRVVAATNLIGGKKSTQIEFLPKHFVSGVDYIFIDTFPDHSATMRGKVVFE